MTHTRDSVVTQISSSSKLITVTVPVEHS